MLLQGTEIGTLIQSCSPDAWQPVVVKVACTVGAGGTCPNANAVPTAAAVSISTILLIHFITVY